MYTPEITYYSMGARQCKNSIKTQIASQLLHSMVQKLGKITFQEEKGGTGPAQAPNGRNQ
jgi:hypothetical protein